MGFCVLCTIYVIITGCLPHVVPKICILLPKPREPLEGFILTNNKLLTEKNIIILTTYIGVDATWWWWWWWYHHCGCCGMGGGGSDGTPTTVIVLVWVML